MGGRFLNKRFTIQDGFAKGQGDDSPCAYFEGDTFTVTRPAAVEGDLTATGATLNSVKVKGGHSVTAWWSVVATWNMGAVPGSVGSTNSVISTDVGMSGAAVGDMVFAVPVGSFALDLHWDAACYSAAVVNLRARYTGSTGAYTPGNVPFKITALKLT